MSAAESQDDETTSSLDRAKQTQEYNRLSAEYQRLRAEGVPAEELISPVWPRGVHSTTTGRKMDEPNAEQLSLGIVIEGHEETDGNR